MEKKHRVSWKNDLTCFISPISPLIEKYKNPPEVKAKHSFKYIYPKTEPTAVPSKAPIAVTNYSPKIWQIEYFNWNRIAKSPTSCGISWKNIAIVVTSPILKSAT